MISLRIQEKKTFWFCCCFVFVQVSGEILYTVTTRVNWTEAVLSCSSYSYRIADTYTFRGVLSAARNLLFWVGIFRREFTKIDTGINLPLLLGRLSVHEIHTIVVLFVIHESHMIWYTGINNNPNQSVWFFQ